MKASILPAAKLSQTELTRSGLDAFVVVGNNKQKDIGKTKSPVVLHSYYLYKHLHFRIQFLVESQELSKCSRCK